MKNLLLLLSIAAPFFVFAQEVSDAFKYKTREVGLNATPFITNFISVGDIDLKDQVAAFTWKKINHKNNGFRLGLGISIDNSSFFAINNSFHFRIGFEKRKLIKNKWWYYWGADALLHVDDFLSSDPNPSFSSGVGAGPVIGMFYEINDMITLSTESSLYIFFVDGINMTFVPPISLFFNMRFKKLKRLYKYLE